MKRSRVHCIRIAIACVALILASIGPSAAPQTAYAGPDPKVLPVLLVHGIDAWGNSKSDWLLGGWIADGLREVNHGSGWAVYTSAMQTPGQKLPPSIFDNAPVYTLDYHGYKEAAGPIRPTAGILASAIEMVKDDSGASKVYIVAHSMGGLITRALIQGLAQDKESNNKAVPYRGDIFGFTTIDTPHRGSSMASSPGGRLKNWSEAAADMRPDSPFMTMLNNPSSRDKLNPFSFAVGNHWGIYGDGVLTALEQTPIDATVPSTDSAYFDVVHGYGMGLALTNANLAWHQHSTKEIPAVGDSGVKSFAIAQYRKAQTEYEAQLSPPGPSAANTVLAIDHSGSMSQQWSSTTKVEGAKSAANTLVDILRGAALAHQSSVSIGLLQFNEETEALLSPTTDYASVHDAISPVTATGSTDLINPIEEGASQLQGAGGGVLILLTDGVDENGNSDDSIVAAADRARAQGITIFTIGFGTPGSDINEDLLKRIAGDDSRYSFADPKSLVGLAGSFLYSQIAAVDKIALKSQGTVQQGQTVSAGEFDLEKASGDLQAVLYWPGSTLETRLTDPAGTVVAAGYPGLTIARTGTPAQMFIAHPQSGHWKMSVYGAETSMADEPYYAIVSVKPSVVSTAPVSGGGRANDDAGLVLGVIVLVFAGGIGATVLMRRPATPEISAGVQGTPLTGFSLLDASGVLHPLKEGSNVVGRATDADVALDSEQVSRHHAVVVVSGRDVLIRDTQSAAGVTVNGVASSEARIMVGDRLQLGDVEVTLQGVIGHADLLDDGWA